MQARAVIFLLIIAMIKVYDRLEREGLKSQLILQVHDELIIDTLKTEQETVMQLLVEEMENAVDRSTGLFWNSKRKCKTFNLRINFTFILFHTETQGDNSS